MNTDLLMAIIPGITVTLFILGLYKVVFEKKIQAQENIQHLSASISSSSPVSNSVGFFVKEKKDKILKRRKKKAEGEKESITDKLEDDLERANLILHPKEFLLMCVGTALGCGLVAVFIFQIHFILGGLIGVASYFVPFLYLKVRIILRIKKATAQFADVLDSMVNGFKTGYGFSRAVQMISDNYDDPWGTEFGKMGAEMNLGLTQEEALLNLSNRIPTPDVDLFVTAMVIQKETGGNMTELLQTLSKTCRDRFKLFQKVGAISAQGKLSAGIIICVPFLITGMMFMFLPEHTMKFFTNPIGIVIVSLVSIWMMIGIGVLWKIVQIEV